MLSIYLPPEAWKQLRCCPLNSGNLDAGVGRRGDQFALREAPAQSHSLTRQATCGRVDMSTRGRVIDPRKAERADALSRASPITLHGHRLPKPISNARRSPMPPSTPRETGEQTRSPGSRPTSRRRASTAPRSMFLSRSWPPRLAARALRGAVRGIAAQASRPRPYARTPPPRRRTLPNSGTPALW